MSTEEKIRAEVDAAVLAERATPEYQAALAKVVGKPEYYPEGSPSYAQLRQDLDDEYIGLGRRFCAHFAGQYVHDNGIKRWFRANCTHWELDEDRYSLKAVAEISATFEAQAVFFHELSKQAFETGDKDRGKAMRKIAKEWEVTAKKCKEPTSMKKVLELASAGADSLGISGREWNSHPNLVACKNTVIDLQTGREVKPDPYLYISQQCPVEWAGLHAESPDWDNFIDQIFLGQQHIIDAAQTCAGYWLTGHNVVQEFFCFLGPQGGNGKGVFFRRLRDVMGSYYASLHPQMLMESKFGRSGIGPTPELLNLRGKRLAVASESKKGAEFSMDEIKRWTGGDPQVGRAMNSDNIVEFVPIFKILFVTNRMPKLSDPTDNAFRRRLRIFRFLAQFTSVASEVDPSRNIFPADPELEQRLKQPEVLSAILAWMVRGAMRFYRNGMTIQYPPEILAEADDYMMDQDLIGQFIRQCLSITDGTGGRKEQAKTVYLSFKRWAMEERLISEKYVPSMSAFGSDFKNRAEIRQVPPVNVVNYNVVLRDEWRPAQGV
jgi:putative DNA primase/helicase